MKIKPAVTKVLASASTYFKANLLKKCLYLPS